MYFSITNDAVEGVIEPTSDPTLLSARFRILNPDIVRPQLAQLAQTIIDNPQFYPNPCTDYTDTIATRGDFFFYPQIWRAAKYDLTGVGTTYYLPTICETRVPLADLIAGADYLNDTGEFDLVVCGVNIITVQPDGQTTLDIWGAVYQNGIFSIITDGNPPIDGDYLVRSENMVFEIDMGGQLKSNSVINNIPVTLAPFPRIGGVFDFDAQKNWWYWGTPLNNCATFDSDPSEYPPCENNAEVIPMRRYTKTYNQTRPFTLRRG